MQVSVLGAGTMGRGIAQVAAMADYGMAICDIEAVYVGDGLDVIESNLRGGVNHDRATPDKMAATLDRLSGITSLEAVVTDTDLAVEAVPEDVELRHEMVTEVESLVNDDAVIASNTLSLSVVQILNTLEYSKHGLGLHFFSPVHIMKLVEVIITEQTSGSMLILATKLVEGIDKTIVETGDLLGFVSSRFGTALGVEAMHVVQEGVTSLAGVDTVMELGCNHPMGPFEFGNAVDLDAHPDILEYLREELGRRFRPPQILRREVHAGKLGKKTGKGFYVWKGDETVGAPKGVMDR